MEAAKIAVRLKGQTTCFHHKGRQLELYCEKCQELACVKCVASFHKGHLLCELSDVTSQRKEDIKIFIARTEENELTQIGNYIDSINALLEDNNSSFDKISTQLQIQNEKLKEDLDELTAETLSLYQKIKDDNTKLILKYKEELQIYEKHLKQQLQECKTVLQEGSHIEVYDTEYEIDSRIHLPMRPVLGSASFTPNINPRDNLTLALGLCDLVTPGEDEEFKERSVVTSDGQEQPSHQESGEEWKIKMTRMQTLAKPMVVEHWKSPLKIDSICPTTDDQAWTSNRCTLTLLDRKGAVTKKITHRSGINCISFSPVTHRLWVCDWKNNILELKSGQLITKFRTRKEVSCLCVTLNNQIIIGVAKHIFKCTTNGQVLLSTKTEETGKPLVCTPWKITECSVTNNVAVIDHNDERDGGGGNKHVVIMDTDFQEQSVYNGDIPSTCKQRPHVGDEAFNPWDIAYDSLGNIIIGDLNNHRILQFDNEGQLLWIAYTGSAKPWCLGLGRENILWTVFLTTSGYNHTRLLKISENTIK